MGVGNNSSAAYFHVYQSKRSLAFEARSRARFRMSENFIAFSLGF